jgi:hypothetical protein
MVQAFRGARDRKQRQAERVEPQQQPETGFHERRTLEAAARAGEGG